MEQGKMYLFSGLIMTIIQGGFVRRFKSDQGIYIALIVSEPSSKISVNMFWFLFCTSWCSALFNNLTALTVYSRLSAVGVLLKDRSGNIKCSIPTIKQSNQTGLTAVSNKNLKSQIQFADNMLTFANIRFRY